MADHSALGSGLGLLVPQAGSPQPPLSLESGSPQPPASTVSARISLLASDTQGARPTQPPGVTEEGGGEAQTAPHCCRLNQPCPNFSSSSGSRSEPAVSKALVGAGKVDVIHCDKALCSGATCLLSRPGPSRLWTRLGP